MTAKSRRRLRDDLEWGVKWGLSMTAAYAAYAVAVALMQWSIRFDAYNANFPLTRRE